MCGSIAWRRVSTSSKRTQRNTPSEFRVWLRRLALTQAQAPRALGMTRTQIQRYLVGRTPVPRTTALACWALEQQSAALAPWGEQSMARCDLAPNVRDDRRSGRIELRRPCAPICA
jgi:hypothetical protein